VLDIPKEPRLARDDIIEIPLSELVVAVFSGDSVTPMKNLGPELRQGEVERRRFLPFTFYHRSCMARSSKYSHGLMLWYANTDFDTRQGCHARFIEKTLTSLPK
jgi:hypothetical protein